MEMPRTLLVHLMSAAWGTINVSPVWPIRRSNSVNEFAERFKQTQHTEELVQLERQRILHPQPPPESLARTDCSSSGIDAKPLASILKCFVLSPVSFERKFVNFMKMQQVRRQLSRQNHAAFAKITTARRASPYVSSRRAT